MGHVRLFFDETYPKEGSSELVAVAAVAVFKSQWPRYIQELRPLTGLGDKRRLDAIREFIATRRLQCVVAGTRLDLVGASPKSRDEYSDVSLSRRDRIWVQTMGSAAALLTRRVLEIGWNVARFDLFYDPKSLAKEHRDLVQSSLRKVMEKQTTLLAKRPVTIGKIKEVPKAVNGNYNELSEGTGLAHWIAKLPHEYAGARLPSNIEIYDVAKYFL